MKLTTDYERQRSVSAFNDKKVNKVSLKPENCPCRELAAVLLQHGHVTAHLTTKLKEKIESEWNKFNCKHCILFNTLLALDKNHGILAFMHSSNVPFINLDAHGQSLLHWAVKRNALNAVHELLQIYKPDVHKWITLKDKHGVTPLHLAAQHESPKILKVLLAELSAEGPKNLFLETRDKNGQSPLHYCAAAGSLSACELLLNEQWGLPLDQKDSFGQTPLMYAVGCKDESVVRLLASKKSIAVAVRNKRGMTALHVALLADNVAAVRVLLDELNCSPTVFDNENRTPLHYAALYGRSKIADLLLQSGAINETRDCHNVTAAHYAAQSGHYETLKCILLKGSGSKDVLDGDNRSCLMWAVVSNKEDMVRRMLSDREIIHFPKYHKDKKQLSALHLAALVGSKEICKLLVDDGFNMLDRDAYNATPEHLAAGQGHIDALTFFAFNNGGYDLPVIDCMGRTPLFYACLGGQAHAVELMSKSTSPSLNSRQLDSIGQSAIHCAVLAGSLPCIKVLLQHGHDPNIIDQNGLTALDLAIAKDHSEIADFLSDRTRNRR